MHVLCSQWDPHSSPSSATCWSYGPRQISLSEPVFFFRQMGMHVVAISWVVGMVKLDNGGKKPSAIKSVPNKVICK